MTAQEVILFTKWRQTREIALLPSRSRKGSRPSLGAPERGLRPAGCRDLPLQQVEAALITSSCLKTASLVQADIAVNKYCHRLYFFHVARMITDYLGKRRLLAGCISQGQSRWAHRREGTSPSDHVHSLLRPQPATTSTGWHHGRPDPCQEHQPSPAPCQPCCTSCTTTGRWTAMSLGRGHGANTHNRWARQTWQNRRSQLV